MSAVSNAYATLMSPFIEHVVGHECGDAGVDPEGRESTLTLQAEGRTDLLRNVLRGPNPEARVYAARALADMHAIAPDDAKVIRTLAAMRF